MGNGEEDKDGAVVLGRAASKRSRSNSQEDDRRVPQDFEFNRFSPAPNFKLRKIALPGIQNLCKIIR
jgi:hypothetical protein